MLTVACVFKTGGDYEPAHVAALRASVERNLTLPHDFVCLTDSRHVAGHTLPLRHGWPGWWSKLELFDGRLGGDVVYLDLDTIAVGNMNGIALGHRFTVLENFWATDRIGSGLLAWSVDLRHVYDKFALRPDAFMHEYVTTEKWGDQGFIKFNSDVPLDRWQRLHPGKVVSFKRHCRPAGHIPPAAAVVCFHGKPRPWAMTAAEWRWFRARGVQSDVQLAGARA